MARENEELDPKKIVEDLNRGFEAFKEEHKKGAAADKEVLARIEKALSDAQAREQKFLARQDAEEKALNEKLERLEKAIGRGAVKPGEAEKQEAEQKAAYAKWLRRGVEGLSQTGEWKSIMESKALVPSDDTAGGYLAPIEYINEIIKAQVLYSPMRSLVRVRKTAQKAIWLPKRTSTSSATWTADAATRSESTNPGYGLMEVPVHEMTAEHYVSMSLLEDSAFDIEAELNQEFAEQFAVAEGAAVVSGNGVGKPWGFLDAGNTVIGGSYFKVSGSSAVIADANGVADGVIDAFHAIKSAYAANGKWLFNRKTLGAVRKLKDSQKRYIWEPSPAVGSPSLLLGAPYVEVPDMPDEGANAYPMAFGDWQRAYTLVDRIAMSVTRDPYTKASVGQVKFVARKRVGGHVTLAEAIELVKCST